MIKRVVYLLCLSFICVACSLRESYSEDGTLVNLCFEATINDDGSKTVICPSETGIAKVFWSPKEKISLFYPDGDIYNSSCFTSTNTDTASAVTFEGEIIRTHFFGHIEGSESSPMDYFAVYPFDDDNAYEDSLLYLNIHKLQLAKDASFSDCEFPAVAKTSDNNLCFRNVCGGLSFTVENPNIKSLVFTACGGKAIAGRAKVHFDENNIPIIKSFADTSHSVTLLAPDRGTFKPGVRYYMTLAPAVLDAGFKLLFLTESTKADTTVARSIEVKRSVFGYIENIDNGLDFTVKAQQVVINNETLVLRKGDDSLLVATVLPSDATDKQVLWSSSDNDVATVSPQGAVSAISTGQCYIKAVSHEDQFVSDSCLVVVKPEVDSVKVKGQVDFEPGEQFQFSAVVYPEGTEFNKVQWSSSDTKVAVVDDNGLVSAVKDGNAWISITSLQCPDVKDSIKISVVTVKHLDEGGNYANCYIISEPGVYDFLPVKGTSGTNLGNIATAEVLWEYVSIDVTQVKVTDIIKSVEIKKNRVRITTPSILKSGNASIAVKDAAGKILWSWHIWVQDGYDIDAESILCKNGQYLMGRHLGSVSAQRGAPRGLVYQWGRKDPFIAHSRPNPYSSVTWPSAVESTSSTGTMQYTVENPMTFIKGNQSNDWYYASDTQRPNRWSPTSKTDNDPCPYGWRMPSGGADGFWDSVMDLTKSYKWDDNYYGIDLQNVFSADQCCWFQCTGYIDKTYVFRAMDSLVMLWSSKSSLAGNNAYYFGAFTTGSIITSSTTYCAEGLSVRCVKDQTTK